MSVPEKGKKLQKTGEKLPPELLRRRQARIYAKAVADALRGELRESGLSTKTIMSWTHAGERTVKGWLAGSNGPRGECLIELMRSSDLAFGRVLNLSGRGHVVSDQQLLVLRTRLSELVATIDAILKSPQVSRRH